MGNFNQNPLKDSNNMSCEDNDKVLCCKKIYKKIFVEDTQTGTLKPVLMIQPVFCALLCPEDCEENVFDFSDPSIEFDYVNKVVETCAECLEDAGCSENFAIFFDSKSCSFFEQSVVSQQESVELASASEHVFLVEFIPCSNVPLSRSSPTEHNSITENFSKNFSECFKPCCYLLENNTYGCCEIHESKCNILDIQNYIPKFNLNILETKIIEGSESCLNTSCYENVPHFSEKINENCGICCILNSCYYLCNIKKKNVKDYCLKILGISPPAELLETNFISTENDHDNISAQELCNALQGVFKGYNTVCDENQCDNQKIFFK
jgi:hypothetical protein